jgi:CRISPR-associated endonuclease/helicase Cas3
MSLAASDFDAWMQAVHGQRPFPWQRRLLDTVRSDGWPETITLPTATGKTSALDVALFALALEAAERPPRRRMPMRIAFVIDRRIVVDAAHERANRIRDALADRARGGVTARVAEALLTLGGEHPLHVAALRGGIYREDRWARQPNQPTILCSTVDQVGSRLLHRGYGLSSRTWPIHAGLLGNDTLIILDEAHCSQPFFESLEQLARLREARATAIDLPWRVVAMTATPRESSLPFELDEDDLADEVLKARLGRPRPITLQLAEKGDKKFIAALHRAVEAQLGPGRTVMAVVNRVRTARALFESLEKIPKAQRPDAILLTGRARGVERDRLLEQWQRRLMAGRDRASVGGERCLVVVATQCVEVGADLDVDALVTEAAPLDALRQRLGRLNRLGALESAPCTIISREELAWSTGDVPPDDPIYGTATAETWRWLCAQEREAPLDGGVSALTTRAEGHDRKLDAPTAQAPIIFPEYCDLWAQTEPAPEASPDPAVFLHGPDRGAPEVQLVWRADLDGTAETDWASTVALCPPVAGETLAVRLHTVRDWLLGVLKPDKDDTADLEGLGEPKPTDADPTERRPFLRWRGAERSELGSEPDALRPGDTIVVPSSYGGCDGFGWNPESIEPVIDVADEARRLARRAPVLRLHPTCAAGTSPLASASNEEEPDDLAALLEVLLAQLAAASDASAPVATALLADPTRRIEPHPSGRGYVVIGRAGWAADAADFSDEDESSSTAPLEVTLDAHQRDVRDLAESFARSIGLPAALVDDLALAGHLHDLGKADPRFQAWLRDGNRLAALRGPLLAKSPKLAPGGRALARARERAMYPVGGRHELLSVRLIESAPELLARAHDAELVLHLVESHHGFCRPFAPVVSDARPVAVQVSHEGHRLAASSATGLERLDAGPADRFFRLVRRYGWWGLSYLEACVRLADHRASEFAERRRR